MLGRQAASKFAIIVDTAESCEIHHFATLVGFGASVILPYGAYATLKDWNFGQEEALENYRHAAEKRHCKSPESYGYFHNIRLQRRITF